MGQDQRHDDTLSMNRNTNVMSTAVTGILQPVLSVMPATLGTLTWSFATGECGSENWGDIPGQSVADANVKNFVAASKNYILSTGGAAGSFTCASDAGFDTFIRRYSSGNLIGIDFDIEAPQSQHDIDNLVKRVKVAQAKYPALRFSFALAGAKPAGTTARQDVCSERGADPDIDKQVAARAWGLRG